MFVKPETLKNASPARRDILLNQMDHAAQLRKQGAPNRAERRRIGWVPGMKV